MPKSTNKLDDLHDFFASLLKYRDYTFKLMQEGDLKKDEKGLATGLLLDIGRRVGYLGKLITELTKLEKVDVSGKEYNMWVIALKIPPDRLTLSALGHCIQVTNMAIGQLEEDIRAGLRDNQGNIIEEPQKFSSVPPKAFIAHGGDSPALSKLKSFLEALGVEPLVVEEQPSEGRSVAENVDWYSRQADCAIILATKGDVDARTSGFIPRGNVLMETGKLQEIFKDRIVYLLQAGTKFPTNISEKVRERFTSQNMDNAFIKIAKELKKFGILRAVKP